MKKDENVMIRTSITLLKNDYDIIKKYSKSINESISKTIRDLALTKIREQEEESLLHFLNSCSFVSKQEQEEIDNLNMDFSFDKEESDEIIIS